MTKGSRERLLEQAERFHQWRETNFSLTCETIVAEIQMLPSPVSAIKSLLWFMCQNPNLDYGMPGALIRFIESFPEDVYVYDLIQTIQQQPTKHNTWLIFFIYL